MNQARLNVGSLYDKGSPINRKIGLRIVGSLWNVEKPYLNKALSYMIVREHPNKMNNEIIELNVSQIFLFEKHINILIDPTYK